jgi:hypothetical protein
MPGQTISRHRILEKLVQEAMSMCHRRRVGSAFGPQQ